MKPVAPGVYCFTGLVVGRVHLIEDPDGLTIIDTGLELAAARILRQVAAHGRKATDIRRILITHAHPDHVGGLPALQLATGAQVFASAIERPVIEGKIPVPRVPPEKLSGLIRLRPPETIFKPCPVHQELQGGETLPVLGGLQAVFTPGHAPGHLAFWQPEQRLLFCGDVLFNLPKLRLPFAMLTVDMQENIRSIRKLVELQPETVIFGHGEPLHKAAPALRRFADSLPG